MELAPQNPASALLPLVLTDSTGKVILIEIRQPDGYVNATKLCQEGGKLWQNYYQNAKTKEFLAALSEEERISIAPGKPTPTNSTGNQRGNVPAPEKYLVESGKNRFQHTWVHPDVAIHLAQWASARFGVAVSRLVRRYQTGQVTTQESINASAQLAENAIIVEDDPVEEGVPAIEADWPQSRIDSIHVTKAKNEVVKSSLPKPAVGDYANLANISNQLALNFQGTTKQFKSDHNIPSKYSLPDVMNKPALSRRIFAECGMGMYLQHNSAELSTMTQKERNESYRKRKDEIKVACDILVFGAPGIIPLSEADGKRKSLTLKRKAGEIEPSYYARSLLQ